MDENRDNRQKMVTQSDTTRPQPSGQSTSRPMQTVGNNQHRGVSGLPATGGTTGSSALPGNPPGGTKDTTSANEDINLSVIRDQVSILDWRLRDDWQPTPEQLTALTQAVDAEWVEVKYPNVPYLPGAWYRKVFDEAFGIGRWSLIEAGQPHRSADGYYQGFVFKVGRVPIKKVAGYMAQQGNNSVLTPGIALEGMRTNAIMRVAKDLGVARELWWPAWTRKWLREYCVEVGRTKSGLPVMARKDDSAGFDALSYELEAVAGVTAENEYGEGVSAHFEAIREERPTRRRTSQAARDARTMETIGNLEQTADAWGRDDEEEAAKDTTGGEE